MKVRDMKQRNRPVCRADRLVWWAETVQARDRVGRRYSLIISYRSKELCFE